MPKEKRPSDEFELDYKNGSSERYGNDDYKRYAGPDYQEEQYPGVSGKTQGRGTWFNRNNYDKQRLFIGKGPKGYRRSDDRIYEEVCEALMKSPDVDAIHIGVRVTEGRVLLEGHVPSRQMKRLAEYLVEDLPGVIDVKNELKLFNEGGSDVEDLSL